MRNGDRRPPPWAVLALVVALAPGAAGQPRPESAGNAAARARPESAGDASVRVQPESAGDAAARARLDAVLAGAVRREDVLGVVAIAVTREGVIYRRAFGTADDVHDRPIRTDALFRIMSMTKPVTSVAAMQLVERGVVQLDAPAARYLPALAASRVVVTGAGAGDGRPRLRPPATPITVRHLLTHTAGFGYAFTSVRLRDLAPERGDPVGPLLFDPGTAWWYGTSTDWLGRLVEAVSGRDLATYFREEIFEPLGMSETMFNPPAGVRERIVALARRQPGGALYQEVSRPPAPVTTFSGGGGLWSTAGDYARFLRMWLGGGALDGRRVLAADTVAMMSANQVGALPAGAIVSAQPDRSNDFQPTRPGRGRFGFGVAITLDDEPGRRAAGSLTWGGLHNTYFWIDPASGVGGALLTQVLPFADRQVLAVFEAFERAVYTLVAPAAP